MIDESGRTRADEGRMKHEGGKTGSFSDGSETVIGACMEVHRHLGPGLLESSHAATLSVPLQRLAEVAALSQLSATVLQRRMSGPASKRAMKCRRLRKTQAQCHLGKLQISALEIAHGQCFAQVL